MMFLVSLTNYIFEGGQSNVYYGERKLILRVAFEKYLMSHPELQAFFSTMRMTCHL